MPIEGSHSKFVALCEEAQSGLALLGCTQIETDFDLPSQTYLMGFCFPWGKVPVTLPKDMVAELDVDLYKQVIRPDVLRAALQAGFFDTGKTMDIGIGGGGFPLPAQVFEGIHNRGVIHVEIEKDYAHLQWKLGFGLRHFGMDFVSELHVPVELHENQVLDFYKHAVIGRLDQDIIDGVTMDAAIEAGVQPTSMVEVPGGVFWLAAETTPVENVTPITDDTPEQALQSPESTKTTRKHAMQTTHKDTLAYHLGERPAVLRRNMSNTPLDKVTNMMAGRLKGKKRDPLENAIQFYSYNHAVAELSAAFDKHAPLGTHLGAVETYFACLNETLVDLFHYLMFICAGEACHISDHGNQGLKQSITKELPSAKWFWSTGSSSGAHEPLVVSPPKMTLGQFTQCCVSLFEKGQWGGSYGGEPWRVIAEYLNSFVYGEITGQALCDVAFALEHNGGCMFNKNIVYSHPSSNMTKVLDVQRGGQMLRYIKQHCTGHEDLTNWYEEWKGEPIPPVDWVAIQEAGSVGSYVKTPPKPKKPEKPHIEPYPGQKIYLTERPK